MPIDIYDKQFQNWLKGVFGLNTTRTALCKCISGKFEDYIKDIPSSELKQFFCCLKSNQIYRLKTQSRGVKPWSCKHDRCRDLMERFVNNHTNKHVLHYQWNLQTSSSPGNFDHCDDNNLTWNVIVLYMHIDRNESAENLNSLESLDISHVIRVMRNCKLSSPDGSTEPYDEVLKSRNKLMHSPSNTISDDETQKILQWAKKLLDCLDISEESYYKEAVQYLQDIAVEDFVIKYQSEECKQILEEVLKAKHIADTLYQNIEEKNQNCKKQCKRLQEMLGNIARFRFSKYKRLEMVPIEYKSRIKETLMEKHKAILNDIAESDAKSDQLKKLKELEKTTSQDIKEIQRGLQKAAPKKKAKDDDNLNNDLFDRTLYQRKSARGLQKVETKEKTKDDDNLNNDLLNRKLHQTKSAKESQKSEPEENAHDIDLNKSVKELIRDLDQTKSAEMSPSSDPKTMPPLNRTMNKESETLKNEQKQIKTERGMQNPEPKEKAKDDVNLNNEHLNRKLQQTKSAEESQKPEPEESAHDIELNKNVKVLIREMDPIKSAEMSPSSDPKKMPPINRIMNKESETLKDEQKQIKTERGLQKPEPKEKAKDDGNLNNYLFNRKLHRTKSAKESQKPEPEPERSAQGIDLNKSVKVLIREMDPIKSTKESQKPEPVLEGSAQGIDLNKNVKVLIREMDPIKSAVMSPSSDPKKMPPINRTMNKESGTLKDEQKQIKTERGLQKPEPKEKANDDDNLNNDLFNSKVHQTRSAKESQKPEPERSAQGIDLNKSVKVLIREMDPIKSARGMQKPEPKENTKDVDNLKNDHLNRKLHRTKSAKESQKPETEGSAQGIDLNKKVKVLIRERDQIKSAEMSPSTDPKKMPPINRTMNKESETLKDEQKQIKTERGLQKPEPKEKAKDDDNLNNDLFNSKVHQTKSADEKDEQKQKRKWNLKDGSDVRVYVEALCNYDANYEIELSFKKGDILMLLNGGGEGSGYWYTARHTDPTDQNNKHGGNIPKEYVKRVETVEPPLWYFGRISRENAENMLVTTGNQNGTFLVRESESLPGKHALAIRGDTNTKPILHYLINSTDDGLFYISETIEYFTSIEELVDYFKGNNIEADLKLKSPCPRKRTSEMSGKRRETIHKLEIKRESLQFSDKLETGLFCEVWKGKVEERKDVIIKKLVPRTMTKEEFLFEATIMNEYRHEQLVELLAVCSKDEPFYIITEFFQYNLLEYLRGDRGQYLGFPRMVDIARQIARGMVYLESCKIIHGNLSARNILIDENNFVKVAEYGFAKIMDDGAYIPKPDTFNFIIERTMSKMPWISPEAKENQRFTVHSDVWSYGIVLVEITSYGQVPNQEMSYSEVRTYLRNGYAFTEARIPTKPMTDKTIACLNEDPKERPDFITLFDFFDNYLVPRDPHYAVIDIKKQ